MCFGARIWTWLFLCFMWVCCCADYFWTVQTCRDGCCGVCTVRLSWILRLPASSSLAHFFVCAMVCLAFLVIAIVTKVIFGNLAAGMLRSIDRWLCAT